MRTHALTALIALSLWVQPAASRGAEPASEPGLVGEYFAGGTEIAEGAEPFYVRVDERLDFEERTSNFADSKLNENFVVRWTGVLRIEKPGTHTFFAASDDGSRVTIGDKVVVDHWGTHPRSEKSGTVDLAAGDHPIRVDYQQGTGGASCVIFWQPPGGPREVLPASVLFHAKGAANVAYDA